MHRPSQQPTSSKMHRYKHACCTLAACNIQITTTLCKHCNLGPDALSLYATGALISILDPLSAHPILKSLPGPVLSEGANIPCHIYRYRDLTNEPLDCASCQRICNRNVRNLFSRSDRRLRKLHKEVSREPGMKSRGVTGPVINRSLNPEI
jgi:hypothetical protein